MLVGTGLAGTIGMFDNLAEPWCRRAVRALNAFAGTRAAWARNADLLVAAAIVVPVALTTLHQVPLLDPEASQWIPGRLRRDTAVVLTAWLLVAAYAVVWRILPVRSPGSLLADGVAARHESSLSPRAGCMFAIAGLVGASLLMIALAATGHRYLEFWLLDR